MYSSAGRHAANVNQPAAARTAGAPSGANRKRSPSSERYAATAARPSGRGGRGGSSSSRGLPPLPQEEEASLEDVMQMNHAAMEALRQGRTEESHGVLDAALAAAQCGVRRMQFAVENSTTPTQKQRGGRGKRNGGKPRRLANATAAEREGAIRAHEAWLLAYAVTLSNLGCQLRCEDNAAAALACLQDAREIESRIGSGKPSCSTMMNLSAVLLGMSRVEEALGIAKDCVAAAQQADPVLFITALHNLAVTLGQHPGDRERSAALPTMLRALKEAQEFLGAADATTDMLRGKCAATHDWVVSQRPAVSGGVGGRPQLRAPSPPPLQQQQQAPRKAPVNLAPLSSAVLAGTGPHSATSPVKHSFVPVPVQVLPAPVAGGGVQRLPLAADAATTGTTAEKEGLQRVKFARPHSSEGRDLAQTTAYEELHLEGPPDHATAGSTPGSGQTSSQITVSEVLHDGQPRPSSAGSGLALMVPSQRASSNDGGGASSMAAAVHNGGGGAPPSGPARSMYAAGYRVNVHATDKPSFLRFAAVEDMRALAENPAVADVYECLKSLRQASGDRQQQQQPRASASSSGGGVGGGAPPALSARLSTLLSACGAAPRGKTWLSASTFSVPAPPSPEKKCAVSARRKNRNNNVFASLRAGGGGTDGAESTTTATDNDADGAVAAARAARLAREQLEESGFRARLAREKEAAEMQSGFEAALATIVARTRDRAARRVQHLWVSWWRLVGQHRRAVMLKRAEERERRLRDRLAALGSEANSLNHDEQQQRLRATAGKDAGGRYAAPAAVVRCGRQWLRATAGVRFLTRCHLHRGIPGHPLQGLLCPRFTEAQVQRWVTAVQARWRGVHARRGFAVLMAERDVATARAAAVICRREDQDYAALVIQNCWRCHAARTRRVERFSVVYTPAALVIQRWYRATIASQRARGVDGRTVRRCTAAALIIQCAWRRYLARLQRHVARIKRHVRVLRMLEQEENRIAAREGREARKRLAIEARPTDAKDATSNSDEGSSPTHAGTGEQGFVSARTGAFYKDIPVAQTPYETACLDRVYGVYRKQEADYEDFDVPLHLKPAAARHHAETARSIRLRPFDVARRRAADELWCEDELYVFRRNRAAAKVQRLFRRWRRQRDDPRREKTLLMVARARYRQAGLERQSQRSQARRELRAAAEFHGYLRPRCPATGEARFALEMELSAERARSCAWDQVQPVQPVDLPGCARPLYNPVATIRSIEGEPLLRLTESTGGGGGAGSLVLSPQVPRDGTVPVIRTRGERYAAEVDVARDEDSIARTYPRDLARLRGDVYYTGYPNGAFANLD